jgi:septal ring factor EnvC (AmiA/AmiB activator)
MTVLPHTTTDLVVEERETTRFPVDWFSAIAETAVKVYLADSKSDGNVVQKLSAAWVFRTEIVKKRDERSGVQSQSNDLSQTAEEARRNLRAIEKNKAADALRQKLTARLAEVSGKLDEVNKKLTEIDARLAELRVQFTEAVRAIQLVVPVSKTP